MRLQGRVVFVTGASRGIGRACAIACAREGADVVVTGRTEVATNPRLPGTIHEVASEVEAVGRAALPIRLDVRDEEACGRAVEQAMERFGRIDALVNNAAAMWWADVVETPVKKFDHIMSVNLRAAFVLGSAILPHMIRRRFGHIAMIAPPAEGADVAHHGVYAISKVGMTLLGRAIAEEAREHNVAAYSLWPATPIDTSAFGEARRREERRRPRIVADALVALLSREPAYATGGAYTDEEVLRDEGVTDFSHYRSMPPVEVQAAPNPAAKAAPPPSSDAETERK